MEGGDDKLKLFIKKNNQFFHQMNQSFLASKYEDPENFRTLAQF